VSDFQFDVMGVSETWLRPNTPSDIYSIPGYTMVRCDRKQQGMPDDGVVGGGVAIYIKQGIAYKQHLLSVADDTGVEYLCIILNIRSKRVGVCVGYRPPNVKYTSLSAFFHSLFVDLAIEVDSVIYLGDNNIDMLSRVDSRAKFLRRLLTELNATQIVNDATRVTSDSATLLDHIIVDRSTEVKRIGVIDASDITDHRGIKITDHKLIYCLLHMKKERLGQKLISYRDFSNFNIDRVVAQVAEIQWSSVRQMQDVNDIEEFVTSNIKLVFDEHAPVVCKRVTRRKAPWRNGDIIRLTKIKNKLRNRFWKSRDPLDWDQYKRARNDLNGKIRLAKKQYFADNLTKTKNPRDFWKCLKSCDIVGNKDSGILPPEITVDEINEFFVGMGSDVDVNRDVVERFKSTTMNNSSEEFNFSEVTEEEVKSAMNEIKSGAVGIDGISIHMIKSVSPYALEAMTHLINVSLSTGVFPTNWKTSIVHPLPKVSTPTTVKDLRPISILPAMSKILEKIVARQLDTHLKANNILPTLQSGFRKNYSTCTALTNMFSDLFDAKDKGRYSIVVVLDYSQAFDSVKKVMLTAKMRYFHFGQKCIDWVDSYFSDRKQITRKGSDSSEPLSKEDGSPQGSCMAPEVFDMYTSDFPSCLKYCVSHFYCDDVQLHLSYEPDNLREAIDQINCDLQNVSEWSTDNGLKLNIDKCAVLHVAPQTVVQTLNENNLQVRLCGRALTVCDKVKTLGVILDSGLTFSEHVTYATQRAMGRLKGLFRFRNLLPQPAKLQIMQSLVLSAFYYCYPAYGNSISREDTYRIQKVQNSAIRFIFCLNRRDHVSPFRDALGLAEMEDVCRVMTNCMTHRALCLGEPRYLGHKLSYREQVSQRSTRQDRKLHFPQVKLEVGRKSYSYFGPKMYNDLPGSLKSYSVSTFKKKIKNVYYKTARTQGGVDLML